jgi:hypothetical protein
VRAIFAASSAEGSAVGQAGARPADEEEKQEVDADKASGDEPSAAESAAGSARGAPDPANGAPVEEEDAEAAEARAYEEEVVRQIARDESACPERAQLEKVLRLKRRFRVIKTATTTAQIERL